MSVISAEQRLLIRSGQGDYAVESLSDIAYIHETVASIADYRIVIDRRLMALYPQLLRGLDVARTLAIPATEDEKTFAGVERVSRFLQETNASKRSTLVVVGGGILQDIGAFAAHIYYRGIPYVLIPTTLLSMADSCIGAKTGINLGSFKNQLGFFQSPTRVLIWHGFTETLEPDDRRSGFGEILKLSIIGGEADYATFEAELAEQGFAHRQLSHVIMRTLRIKQRIVEADEYEHELRKILNYGHTFGHALESLTNHEIPHGLAVAWGVDIANHTAMRQGLLDPTAFHRVHRLIARYFGCTVRSRYDAAGLLRSIKRDKKSDGANVTLVLPAGLGDLRLVPTPVDDALQTLIAEYLTNYDVFSR